MLYSFLSCEESLLGGSLDLEYVYKKTNQLHQK